MSPRTGRPPSKDPKSESLQIRLKKETKDDLQACADKMSISRTAVIEHGIELVKKELGI